MAKKRYSLNALETYIISNLVRIRCGIPMDKVFTGFEVSEAVDIVKCDQSTIWKLCAVQKKDVTFNPTKLDHIVKVLSQNQFNTWDELRSIINDSVLNQDLPYGHIFPDKIHSNISSKGQVVLQKIFPELTFEHRPVRDKVARADYGKLSKYLNTIWYAYFYYPYHGKYGRIIRTVIQIGNTPNDVSTRAPADPRLDDFSGTVEFDRGEMALTYNMTTKSNNSRGLHLKQYVHGGDRIPEVTVGEYLNVGIGGFGLHNIRLIMELQAQHCESDENYTPKIFTEADPDFDDIPDSYKKYLRFEKNNYREVPGLGTFTEQDLERLVNREKKKRFYDRSVRIYKKFQVYFSFPRYSISEDEYHTYYTTLMDLKKEWEERYPIEISAYNLTPEPPKTHDRYHIISDQILEADIVIGFFYHDETSICNSEITIATEQGKKVFGFTPADRSKMPDIFVAKWPEHVYFFFSYPNLESATEYLKDRFVSQQLKKQIDYYNQINKLE